MVHHCIRVLYGAALDFCLDGHRTVVPRVKTSVRHCFYNLPRHLNKYIIHLNGGGVYHCYFFRQAGFIFAFVKHLPIMQTTEYDSAPTRATAWFWVPGLFITFLLANSVLGARLREGQWHDPVNLIGSQTIIFGWCFLVWLVAAYAVQTHYVPRWLKLAGTLCIAAMVSVAFYYLSPFEDFPLAPIRQQPLGRALFRLSYRGVLVGIFVYPVVYYLAAARKLVAEKLKVEKQERALLQIRATRLEALLAERTAALEKTIAELEQARQQLAENNASNKS